MKLGGSCCIMGNVGSGVFALLHPLQQKVEIPLNLFTSVKTFLLKHYEKPFPRFFKSEQKPFSSLTTHNPPDMTSRRLRLTG